MIERLAVPQGVLGRVRRGRISAEAWPKIGHFRPEPIDSWWKFGYTLSDFLLGMEDGLVEARIDQLYQPSTLAACKQALTAPSSAKYVPEVACGGAVVHARAVFLSHDREGVDVPRVESAIVRWGRALRERWRCNLKP